jgi:hypothetical protein
LFHKYWYKCVLSIANLIIIGGFTISPAIVQIPISGKSALDGQSVKTESSSPLLISFVESVADGNPNIRGVYIPDVLALKVIQQPSNQPAFVSIDPDTATQFQMASSYGAVGLLAHNYLAGAYFDDTRVGDKISVVHGDGQIEEYQINSILRFQALQPSNVRSGFLETSSQKQYTAEELFKIVYGGKPHLTLQTCIAKGTVNSWGRLFVIAEPVISKN